MPPSPHESPFGIKWNRRIALAALGLLSGAGLLIFFSHLGRDASPLTVDSPGKKSVESKHSMKKPAPSGKLTWKAGLVVTAEFRVGDFESYLRTNHFPQCSAAVFDLTQDLEFLLDAWTEWPDSPALLKRILLLSGNDDLKRKAGRRLRDLEPANSLSFYLSAAMAIKEGNLAEADSLMQQGVSKKPPNFETSDDIISRRSALAFIGMDRTEASLKSLFPDNRIKAFLEIKKIADFYASPENLPLLPTAPATLDAIIGMLAHLRQTRDGGAFPQLDATNEIAFLRILNPDDWVGDESAADRIGSLQKKSQEAQRIFQTYGDVFPLLSDAELARYADKVLADGEWEAIKAVSAEQR